VPEKAGYSGQIIDSQFQCAVEFFNKIWIKFGFADLAPDALNGDELLADSPAEIARLLGKRGLTL
jgi:hypothetical protein